MYIYTHHLLFYVFFNVVTAYSPPTAVPPPSGAMPSVAPDLTPPLPLSLPLTFSSRALSPPSSQSAYKLVSQSISLPLCLHLSPVFLSLSLLPSETDPLSGAGAVDGTIHRSSKLRADGYDAVSRSLVGIRAAVSQGVSELRSLSRPDCGVRIRTPKIL